MQYAGQEIFDHDLNCSLREVAGTVTAEPASMLLDIEIEEGSIERIHVHCWPNSEEHGDLIGPCGDREYRHAECIAESLGLDEWWEWWEEHKRNPF